MRDSVGKIAVLVIFLVVLSILGMAALPNPGHKASTIGGENDEDRTFNGTLGENYTFPTNLNVYGNVGIGTVDPLGDLHIKDVLARLKVESTGDGGDIILSRQEGYQGNIWLQTNNSGRWKIGITETSESGSNVGSDLRIERRDDDGTTLGNVMFFQRSTGNVGIGTTTPDRSLYVDGDVGFNNETAGEMLFRPSTTNWVVEHTGNTGDIYIRSFEPGDTSGNLVLNDQGGYVGIGTTSPAQALDVDKSARFGYNSGSNAYIEVRSGTSDSLIDFNDNTGVTRWEIREDSGDLKFNTETNANNKVTFLSDGNVGIGTTSPQTSLHIDKTDAIIIPVGNTAQRPSSSLPGQMRYNNQTKAFEGYNGIAWGSIGGAVFVGLTASDYNGNIVNGSFTGYDAGNNICNQEFEGSHMCVQAEVINTIHASNISDITDWTGTAWINAGGAKYAPADLPVNDCNGWTHGAAGSYLGNFWIFEKPNGGRGAVVNCGSLKPLACCR